MLNKVSAKNFLSWKELDFSIPKSVTLVDGWNEDDQRSEGSGKSAVLNAISWAIYGKLPKDVNIDDVIKDGEKSCSVVLEFDNGDSIVRTRKPNDLYILKAGATIKGKDAKETQSFIEEYVGCNFETFCQSVYFAQNYNNKFLSSNQADKGKILSSIQNLQVFDKARKETMDLLKTENETITKLKNNIQIETNNLNNLKSQKSLLESFISDKIQKHNQQLTMLLNQRDMLSGHVKRTEDEIQSVNERMLAIDLNALDADLNELNAVKTDYSSKLSDVTYQKSQIDSIKKTIQAKESEGTVLANKVKTIQTKIESLVYPSARCKSILTNIEKAQSVETSAMYKSLRAKEAKLVEFIANPTSTCPSCGTELKEVDVSHTEKELEDVRDQIQSLVKSSEQQVSDLTSQLNQEIESDGNLSEQLAVERANIMAQLTLIAEYLDANPIPSMDDLIASESELKSIIKQIDDAVNQTNFKKIEHAKLLNQLSSLNNQMESYNQQFRNVCDSISSLGSPDVSEDQDKLNSIQESLMNVGEKEQELHQLLEKSNAHAAKLETLKEGFKEIKSYVFTNALNELNFRANQYLNELFEMEASIKFSNEDQEIETNIVLNGNQRSLGLLSGGQLRRINLAVDLALADIVSYRKTSKLDLLIFDEYFKDLSEISMEKCLDLLKSRKCPVVLIEHNTAFKNIVDNTFFVRLENGTSFESRG